MENDDQLDYLMSCYFHEDFAETGGLWGTLDVYLRETSPDLRAALVASITELLARADNEATLRNTVTEMGCAVHLDAPNGYREWLEEIASRVSAAD